MSADDLLLEFLAWVDARPRTYAETMEAWRSHCPRHTVWEDACLAGLVGTGAAATTGDAPVRITDAGRERLRSRRRTT